MRQFKILSMFILVIFLTQPPTCFGNDKEVKMIMNVWKEPYKSICKILAEFDGKDPIRLGTGFLVSRRVVITAAHNLYDRKTQKKAKKVKVIPCQHDSMPFGDFEINAENIIVCSLYTKLKLQEDFQEDTKLASYDDYGAVILPSNKKITNYLTIRNYTSLKEMNVMTAGYMIEGNINFINYMHESSGKVSDFDNNFIFTNVPGVKGFSGGPLITFTYDPILKKYGPIVVGIVIATNSNKEINVLRISKWILETIKKWIKENP